MIGAVLSDKLQRLVAFAGGMAPPAEIAEPPRSPAAILDAIRDIASSAACSLTQAPGIAAEVHDLFAFLAHLPGSVAAEIRALGSVPPEPARAWEESRMTRFWELAALIQDVWEHALGPESVFDPRFREWLDRLEPGDVLDFGSGAGTFAFHLAGRGSRVTCVEKNAVKRAFLQFRRARHSEGGRVVLRPGSRVYDCVLAVNVLDHLRDPVGMVRALTRRLRPGGRLVGRAAFLDDGWHSGGAAVRDAVSREVFRVFAIDPDGPDSGGGVFSLRRREFAGSDDPSPGDSREGRVQLHPGATFESWPGPEDATVLTAAAFYVRPLLLWPEGAGLAALCRCGIGLRDLIDQMGRAGFAEEDVRAAVAEMIDARLLIETPGGAG